MTAALLTVAQALARLEAEEWRRRMALIRELCDGHREARERIDASQSGTYSCDERVTVPLQ